MLVCLVLRSFFFIIYYYRDIAMIMNTRCVSKARRPTEGPIGLSWHHGICAPWQPLPDFSVKNVSRLPYIKSVMVAKKRKV